jgi:hypothetical protein
VNEHEKKAQEIGVLCPHGKIHVEAALGGAVIDQAKLEVKQVTALGFIVRAAARSR